MNAEELLERLKELVSESGIPALLIVQRPKGESSISWVNMGPGQATDLLNGARDVVSEKIKEPTQ